MPNEEREQRLSELGKAAIGLGATAAFFSRTQLGREIASEGVTRTRHALLKSSEQLRGKTLASMWGRGAKDIKRVADSFKDGFNDTAPLNRLPLEKNSLIDALLKRRSFLNQETTHINRFFNKEYLPQVLNNTIRSFVPETDEVTLRYHREIVDDLLTRRNESILMEHSHQEANTFLFSQHFEQKLRHHYGDRANEIQQALQYDLANIETHQATYKTLRGDAVLSAIQKQASQFETYESAFKPKPFWDNLIGQQSATVKDILERKEQFANQTIDDVKIVDLLQEMVDQDQRFEGLVIDPSLKLKDDKIYNYNALRKTLEATEDMFLNNVGRIIKPLEVQKHIKESPHFFFIPKGAIDSQLQALMEPESNELQYSYLRLIDKTYRIKNDGTLEHLPKLDDTYLTPAKGFEGQHIRRLSGNIDFNLDDNIVSGDSLDATEQLIYNAKKHLGIIGTVSKDYKKEVVKAQKKNKRLAAIGLTEEAEILGDFDNMRLMYAYHQEETPELFNPRVYDYARSLIKDLDNHQNAVLPSNDAIEKISASVPLLDSRATFRHLLADDQTLLAALIEKSEDTRTTSGDILALARHYKSDPIGALNQTYYHSGRSNGFIEEVKREFFKEALYSSNVNNDLGALMAQIENADLSSADLKKVKHLTALSYLQNTMQMSIKSPDIITDVQIANTHKQLGALIFNNQTEALHTIYQQVSDENAVRHAANLFERDFLLQHVSVADRPSQYMHMRKGITVLDLIEPLNQPDGKLSASTVGDFFSQFIAGRQNMQDVTTQTLYPYFGLFRLQNDVRSVRMNLGREDTGSVLAIAKNITTKRALPLYALGFGAAYLNYESENFFGQSFTNMAAEATAKIDLGVRSIADTLMLDGVLKDAHYWFTPLNYLQENEYQNAQERKSYYESGYDPVRQSKFWSLGSSEFFGGKINYFQPNFVKRTQVNWQDIGVYGSTEDKWQHSLIPTPRHPLSTIRYLTNPYWLEEKHQYSRPYVVSGPMFDPNTPWGAIGNLTIGQLIKPQKKLNQAYMTDKGVDVRHIIEAQNNQLMDEARSNGTLTIKSGDTAIENALSPSLTTDYSTGVMSVVNQERSGIGNYVARQDYKDTHLSLVDKLQVFTASLGVSRERILNQVERMNYAIREKAKWSYGNDTQFAKNISDKQLTNDTTLIHHKQVERDLRLTTSNQDMLADLTYSIQQLSGIYNFIGESILPRQKQYTYARSSDMYAASNRFWQSGIDGADYGGFMEIARRFIPNEDRNRIRVNPLRNNMPSWIPARFHNGDPYTMIKKGELRLPGAGYEALHGLEDKSSFVINSDYVGLDAQTLVNRTIASNNAPSEAVTAYQEALLHSGLASAINKGVHDSTYHVSGAYDALINESDGSQSVMQIKALDARAYEQILLHGANQQDLANVNYYVGQEKLHKGYVTYINNSTKAMQTFDINFSQILYQQSLASVREARKTLTESVSKGILSPYELYDDFTRFSILADIAPGSAEYKKYRQIVQSNLSTESQKASYEAILDRVDRQSQRHRFFNYKFTNVEIDRSRGVIEYIGRDGIKLVGDDTTYSLAGLKNYHQKIYDYLAPGMRVQMEYERNYNNSQFVQAAFYANGLNVNRQMMRDGVDRNDDGSAMATRALLTKNQIALGKPFELLSHMPIPFIHNKFLRINTPYESWMNENIYGSKFSSWDNPIQTIVRPAFQQAWGSSLTHGLLGAGLFALNEYLADATQNRLPNLFSDLDINKASKYARLSNLFFTPGAFAGEVTERVLTLEPNVTKWSSGTGARIGSIVGLAGIALANASNPFVAAASGAGIGATIGEWLETGGARNGTLIGTTAGLVISAFKTEGFNHRQLFSEYIPRATQERFEIEEYFDRLEYLKYKGLYEKASRLAFDKEGVDIGRILSDMDKREQRADSKIKQLIKAKDNMMRSSLSYQTKMDLLTKIDAEIDLYANPAINVPATPYVRLAIGYKQAMESTVYGLDDTSSWAQILRALEPYEREYFLAFAKVTNPREQKKILKAIDPYKRKILENAWGLKKRTKQTSNIDYFKSYKLPGTLWKGWRPETDLEHYKVKTIMNEGMMLSDFGYYDSEKNEPGVQQANALNYKQENVLGMRLSLLNVMHGMGISESDIAILPSQQSGIQTVINVATLNTHKIKQGLSVLGAQFL